MNNLDLSFDSYKEARSILERLGAKELLIKKLSRNHNDKNQVYAGSDLALFQSRFEMSYEERGFSESATKRLSDTSKRIPEARFESFHWMADGGFLVEAQAVKVIIYAQYPEVRLSGFKTVDNRMPYAMSVDYTKGDPDAVRYLILARTQDGAAIGVMVNNPGQRFIDEVQELPKAAEARTWFWDLFPDAGPETLRAMLARQINMWHAGERLKQDGTIVPFSGTQVCGYTLEKVLEIPSNSGKDGDIFGIELKACTQKRVTLFTPEPDMGEYSENFAECMKHRGYESSSGIYRITGIHKAGTRCAKSGLTLSVEGYKPGDKVTAKFDEIYVGLFSDDNKLVAGWSLERLLNNWSQKHNEAVYVFAEKRDCEDQNLTQTGVKYEVKFNDEPLWCNRTSPERLLNAIVSGTIYLDPAPKYVENNPSQNKRRSQWRVSDIYKAANEIYESAKLVELV